MPKRISVQAIRKIQELRQKGYSLPEIVKNIQLGYGTIYRYIKDVKILPEYRERWFGKRGGSRKRKKMAEDKAYREAHDVIASISDKEFIILLSALYWGEGSKADFGITNSDPDLIRLFVTGLIKVLHVSPDRIRVSIRLYEDLDRDICLTFWSSITGVPKEKFLRIDVLKGKKSGKLKHGLCRVRVLKGGDLLKYLNAVKSVVVEKTMSL